MNLPARHARNLVVMLTAGGALHDILAMAHTYHVGPQDVRQLDVPEAELGYQQALATALDPK